MVEHLRLITLGEFADGKGIRLSKCDETNDYLAEKGAYPNIIFIEGPEV